MPQRAALGAVPRTAGRHARSGCPHAGPRPLAGPLRTRLPARSPTASRPRATPSSTNYPTGICFRTIGRIYLGFCQIGKDTIHLLGSFGYLNVPAGCRDEPTVLMAISQREYSLRALSPKSAVRPISPISLSGFDSTTRQFGKLAKAVIPTVSGNGKRGHLRAAPRIRIRGATPEDDLQRQVKNLVTEKDVRKGTDMGTPL